MSEIEGSVTKKFELKVMKEKDIILKERKSSYIPKLYAIAHNWRLGI